jgi:superfamily II DNA or RNA helicase
MKIEIEHHVSRLIEYNEDELVWLGEFLSIKSPKFRKNYKTGRMERVGVDKISFLNRHAQFPSGFIRDVVKRCKQKGYSIEFVDNRATQPISPNEDADLNFLRYYQADAVQKVIERKRGVIRHPTGAGKTVVAAGLTIKIPCAWVFIVQSKDLLHQTAAKYKQFVGKEAGIIGDGQFIPMEPGANLMVATAQTLNAKRGDDRIWQIIREAEGIIIDECHQVPARTIMHHVPPQELIEKGYLSAPDITMYKCRQTCNRPTFHGRYNECVVRSTKRNNLVTKLMQMATPPNFTFVRKIDHGRDLTKRARKAGLNTEFVWGNKSQKQREAALTRLVRGDIDYIVCSDVFVLGIDVPELRSVVNAAAGKSTIQALQRIGRGSRVTEDKKSFEVYDVFDTGVDNLQNHAQARRREYKREGYEVREVEEGALLG